MHHNSYLRKIISTFVILISLTTLAQTSRAAFDAYLKIDGVKGDATKTHKIIRCPDGSCSLGRLPVGTYKVTLCWVQGGKTAMDDWSAIMKASANTKGASASTTVTITSKPQNTDAASGAPTGKRRHTPLTFTKSFDAISPILFNITAADVDGDGMLDVMLTCRKAGIPPTE